MVTRKSESSASSPAPNAAAPYPVTPTAEHSSLTPSSKPEAFETQVVDSDLSRGLANVGLEHGRNNQEAEDLPDWDDSDGEEAENKGRSNVPLPLNLRKNQLPPANPGDHLSMPAILQVNRPDGHSARVAQPETSSPLDAHAPYAQIEQRLDGAASSKADRKESTNPFLRNRSGDQSLTRGTSQSNVPNQPWPDYTDEQISNPFEGQDSEYSSPAKSPGSSKQPPLIPVATEDSYKQAMGHESEPISMLEKSAISYTSREPPQIPQQMPQEPLEDQSSQPRLPTASTAQPQVQSRIQDSRSKVGEQRNEVYQIRHIRWYDANHTKNPRHSPVLLQNANGPCPLLALVNALVLSTPPELITALVETLRTREQVSLGLLLDAVFDELTSGRRGATAQVLPDVAELYSFLIALHTGMNVNPRFVAPVAGTRLSNFTGLDIGSENGSDSGRLGCFEETLEMRLYSTFAIPLIHGWVPERSDPACTAFERIAQSYEDAQNVQFREEELEQKLRDSNLSLEDQAFFMDLTTVKQFLSAWPTQLTDHGLKVMQQSLNPGRIAILFRNDHFSTLYKEPKSGQLMTLVTDAGYATHDEIIWENLVDISGTGTEMFSGDFKSVSHDPAAQSHDKGWTTVESRNRRKAQNQPLATPKTAPPASSRAASDGMPSSETLNRSEQEDHDLALAMQLQEEEEERQRNQQAARRREAELSERFLDSPQQRPQIPPRRSQASANGNNASAGEDGAPPPYEQAAADRPFRPPIGHPSSSDAPRQRMYSQQAAQGQQSGVQVGNPGRGGRRRMNSRPLVDQIPPQTPFDGGRRRHDEYAQANSVADRREGCVVM